MSMSPVYSTMDDPALYDRELRSKLDVNRKKAKTNLEAVSEIFALNIFYSGIKYTNKYWMLLLKVRHYPLHDIFNMFLIYYSCEEKYR